MKNSKQNFSTSLEKVSHLLWGLVLLTLPITSFKYFPFLGKHTYVRPLAFYPLALLYLVLFLRLFLTSQIGIGLASASLNNRKGTEFLQEKQKSVAKFKLPWNNALSPLILFLIFAIFTTAHGKLLAPISLREQAYWGRAIRAFLTFGIGMSFFIATLWMHEDMDDVRRSLKWLYAGLALTILWVGIQAIAIYSPLLGKNTVSAWQQLFSIRGLTKVKRVSGFAFEASWLAGQLITLYIPWLFASILTRFRITKNAWIEPLLLIGALASLLLTSSRGGLLIAIIATGTTILISGRKAISRAVAWFFTIAPIPTFPLRGKEQILPPQGGDAHRAEGGRGKTLFLRVTLFILVLSLIIGGIFFISQQKYVNRLWNVEADSLSDYFVQINAGGRITYLWSAGQVFAEHPVFGTGLGAAGFYLYPKFPDWALYNNPEIAQLLNPTSKIYPNAKNLPLRLLAETGIVGFTLFSIFLLAILAQIGTALRDNYKLVGIAGLYSWSAILLYYLMQDSFAMAELWVNFGIVLGIASTLSLNTSPSKRGESQENS